MRRAIHALAVHDGDDDIAGDWSLKVDVGGQGLEAAIVIFVEQSLAFYGQNGVHQVSQIVGVDVVPVAGFDAEAGCVHIALGTEPAHLRVAVADPGRVALVRFERVRARLGHHVGRDHEEQDEFEQNE